MRWVIRTAFWDLETTALKGSFGQLLCGSFAESHGPKLEDLEITTFELDDYSTPRGRCNDEGLALEIADFLTEFDLVIGYNSKRFDKLFLDTRLAKYGHPASNIARHVDLLYTMRYKFSLQSNSLKNVSIFLFGSTLKTDLSWDLWRLAHSGDRESYEAVMEHCEWDVRELARVWERVKHVAGDLKR